jgi:(1->4)-alpha-D-glucan 1-alpha-D-glucosylmutase
MARPGYPIATWRAQFTPQWRFGNAAQLAEYLANLGISDLYASPILEARAGSTHGYDVTDPLRIRGELGGPEAFAALCDAMRARGMGIVLDIVPNHMAADPGNPWWWDVLKRGRASRYARFFDIDWDAAGGKVILPVLGRSLEEALAAGELALDASGDEPVVRYFDKQFPVADDGGGAAVGGLEALLERQHYRLMFWREGLRVINYRRFFDISDLAALRAEDAQVFEESHRLIFALLAQGRISGLRIDHIDGLHDPCGYLQRLRSQDTPPSYLIVEKILAHDEALPREWPVDGSSGYEFLARISALFVDPPGAGMIEADAQQRLEAAPAFEGEARNSKRFVIRELFQAETARLVGQLAEVAAAAGVSGDRDHLREALIETTAALEVYRTYTSGGELSPEDRRRLEHALRTAAACAADTKAAWGDALAFLRRVLLNEPALPAAAVEPARRFIGRWQQFTGPVMAKGVEDTALYRRITLASLNDVGCDPDLLPRDPVGAFHEFCRRRQAKPGSLNATSTHDTKRGEDTRPRISALSEMPREYLAALDRWMEWHAPLRAVLPGGPAPRPADEVLFYQSLLGIWPTESGALEDVAARLIKYLIKAAREAKLRTSWHDLDEQYEQALRRFVQGVVLGPEGERFRTDPDTRLLRERMMRTGAMHSLSQIVLKCAAPGVPDFYRGTELWDLSLVDPDNRRPVDFELRQSLLASVQARWRSHPGALLEQLLDEWPGGAVKLFTMWRVLEFRRRHLAVLERGEYIPLECGGAHGHRLIAFARRLDHQWVLAIVPRLGGAASEAEQWQDTVIILPASAPEGWGNTFAPPDGESLRALGGPERRLWAREMLRHFPCALLKPRFA